MRIMKILILSDIHGNWHALEAILCKESYDYLVFLGDVVDFGPNPRECVRFLIKSSDGQFSGVRGDHDHAMAYAKECLCTHELNILSTATREWSEDLLESEEIGYLRRLPFDNQFSIEGVNFYITHGNNSYFEGYHKPRVNYDLVDFDFILTGHSHKPDLRRIGHKNFLNPGSVGQPRDHNPRASYAVIEDGVATIKRTNYDIGKTVNDLQESNLPRKTVGKLISILMVGGIVN